MRIETAYQFLFEGVLVWFGLLIFLMLVRSILGPRITDRILSINMIGTMVISCILVLSRLLKEGYLVDVALIYAMISFISVLILATVYIPKKPSRGHFMKEVGEEVKRERASLQEASSLEDEQPAKSQDLA